MLAIASAAIHDGMEKVNPLLGGHSNNPFCLHGKYARKVIGQNKEQRPASAQDRAELMAGSR
jgi:hypothetical protein